MNIKDESGKEKYRIDANCHQCGIGWRGSAFGKCYEVFFPIFKMENPSRGMDAADGVIHKKLSACEVEKQIEDAEAVEVSFPKDATKEDKFLLICAALTIDYRYYEENPNEVESEAKIE